MKKPRQIALNKLFNFCVVLGLLFAWGSIEFFVENDTAWGLGFGIVALLLFVFPAIFTPYCYVFDYEGVSLCYIFLPVERYLWKDIHAIEVEDIKLGTSSRVTIFDFFLCKYFFYQRHKCRRNQILYERAYPKKFSY